MNFRYSIDNKADKSRLDQSAENLNIAERFLTGLTNSSPREPQRRAQATPSALERAVNTDRTLTNQCNSGQCVRYAVETQTGDLSVQPLNRYGLVGRVIKLGKSVSDMIASGEVSLENAQQVLSSVMNLATTYGTSLETEIITLKELRERLERGEKVVVAVSLGSDGYSSLTSKSAGIGSSSDEGHAITITKLRPDGTLEIANSGAGGDNFGRDAEIRTWADLERLANSPNQVRVNGEPVVMVLIPPTAGFDTPLQHTWRTSRGGLTVAGDLALDNQIRPGNEANRPTTVNSAGLGAGLSGEYTFDNIKLTGGGVIIDTRTYGYASMHGHVTLLNGEDRRPVAILGVEWARTNSNINSQDKFGAHFNERLRSEGQRLYLGVCLNNPNTALGVQFMRQSNSGTITYTNGFTKGTRIDQETFKVTFVTPDIEISWSQQRQGQLNSRESYASFKVNDNTYVGIGYLEYQEQNLRGQQVRFGIQHRF